MEVNWPPYWSYVPRLQLFQPSQTVGGEQGGVATIFRDT